MRRIILFYLVTLCLIVVTLLNLRLSLQQFHTVDILRKQTDADNLSQNLLNPIIDDALHSRRSIEQQVPPITSTHLLTPEKKGSYQPAIFKEVSETGNIIHSNKFHELGEVDANLLFAFHDSKPISQELPEKYNKIHYSADPFITAKNEKTNLSAGNHNLLKNEALIIVSKWMLPLIGLAILVLIYTIWLFLQQRAKIKSKEKELVRANQLLVNAQQLAGIGNWQFNTHTSELYWSDEVYNIWGRSKNTFLLSYQTYVETIHPQDRVKIEVALSEILKNDKEYSVEHRIVLPDNSIRCVHSLGKKVEISDNYFILEGTVQDITARKKTEAELTFNEAKYRSLVESSMNGILLTIKDGTILSANKAACEMFEMSEAEIVRSVRSDLVDTTDPRLQLLLEERERTGRARGELTFVRKGGSKFAGEVASMVFEDANGEERTSMIIRDITESKRIETTNIFKANLLNTIGQSIMATDASGIIYYWNKAAEDLYGWLEDEAIGKNVIQLVSAQHSIQQAEDIMTTLVRGESWEGEFLVKRKDGTSFPAYVINTPTYNDDKEFSGVIGLSSDITERKKIEQQIIDSEKKYRQIVETAQEGIWIMNEHGITTFVNQKMCEMLEYSQQEILGKPSFYFRKNNAEKGFFERIEMRKVGECETHESVFFAKNGKEVHTKISTSPFFDDAGNFVGSLAMVTDITALKEAEKEINISEMRFRSLIEKSADGIALISREGLLTYLSPSAEKIIDRKKEDFLGTNNYDFIAIEYLPLMFSTFNEVLENPHFSKTIEYECIVTSGERKWLESTYTNLIDEPAINSIVINFHDITERKQADERIRLDDIKLKKAQEIGQLGYWQQDLDSDMIWASKEAKIIYGFPPIEGYLPKQQISDCIIDIEIVRKATIDLIKEQKDYKTEIRIMPADGTPMKYISAMAELQRNDAGQPLRLVGTLQDITEIKKSQQAFIDGEARYKKAQVLGKLGHWELNLETKDLLWSEEIYNIFGLDEKTDNLDHAKFIDFVHPDDKAALEHDLESALIGLTNYNVFHRIILQDGTIRHLHEVAEVIKDENGIPVKLAGMVQDVTEQKILEDNLRLSEANYKLLFEQNPVPLWMVDTDTLQFLEVNQAALSLYGYTINEFLQMNIFDIRLAKEEDIMDVFEKNYRNIPFEDIVQHKKKNKEIISVKVTIQKILYNDKKVLLAAIRDVTNELEYQQALKKREQQLSLVFDNTLNLMWLLKVEDKQEYKIEAVNEALINIVGITEEDMIGKLISEVFDMNVLTTLSSKTDEAVETSLIQKYISISKIKDVEKIFDVNIIPIKGEHEQVIQLLGVAVDLTEQKKAEQQLIQSEEKYRLLFEKSPQPMWIFDTQTLEFLEVNAAAIEHYGYSREEFLHMTLHDVRPKEGNVELVNLPNQNYRETFTGTSLHKKKNGDAIRVQVSVSAIEYENKKARLSLLIDRTDQEKARKDLLQLNIQLRNLAARLQEIREDERTTMAREIHDELGQQLTGLKMDLAWLNRKLVNTDENILAKIKGALNLIDGTINTVRKIAADLRPAVLDDLGLSEAIDWHGREFSKRSSITVNFHSEVTDTKFPPGISIALFRIFQEVLTNVARHANATAVQTSLRKTDQGLLLVISDNGTGFNQQQQTDRKTLGLLGMKERVTMLQGTYNIESEPGKGTTISVLIPLAYIVKV